MINHNKPLMYETGKNIIPIMSPDFVIKIAFSDSNNPYLKQILLSLKDLSH